MTFESMLEEINGFGPFQIATVITLQIPRAVLACHFLLSNFIGVLPPHRCDISTLDNGLFKNLTEEQKMTVSVPARDDGSPESCEMFAEPQFELLANGSNSTNLPTIQCPSGWVYDTSSFTSTVATEWDLVCDRKMLTKTSSTIFLLGVMVGAMAFGYLSDKLLPMTSSRTNAFRGCNQRRPFYPHVYFTIINAFSILITRYGRRSTLLASYIIVIVFGFSSALANSYIVFTVLRFLTGIGLTGVGIIATVLCVEWTSTGHRSFAVIPSMFWSFGSMLLPGLALLIKDWRTLVMTVTAPMGVSVVIWWWAPESARWLLANGKVERAQFYLDRCAKINKRQKLSSSLILETLSHMKIKENQERNYTYLDLIKTPELRRLSLLTGIVWFGVAVTHYGINFNITGFGLNMYLTHFIFAAIEVPAKLMTYCLVNVIGRRRFLIGAQALMGICIAINMFVSKGLWHVRVVVATLGKGLSEASFTALYLYTLELYPTVLRQTGLSYNFLVSRVGITVVPLILLLEDVWSPLSQTILCSVALVCALLYLLLPDTLNVKLPETIDDIEEPRRKDVSSLPLVSRGIKEHKGVCVVLQHQEEIE